MKISKIIILIIFIPLLSCAGYEKKSSDSKIEKNYYSSSGFALIYEESLYKDKTINKKIDNNQALILHNILKRNTPVRITNLKNSQSIDSKIYKKADYPKIFNVLISKKLASILDIDKENPFVEIIELKKNKKFIAKEGNTFDEEKNVAEKAPVDEIEMDELTKTENKVDNNVFKKKAFIIVINDFYYEDSAIELKKDLAEKISSSALYIKKINDKKYRLLAGPFKNFNALKTTYISLNNLGFEGLNIYNE